MTSGAGPASAATPGTAPGPSEERALAYMPALDGLRAVAVAAVIAFHLFPREMPGGFTGVDVFFVLSGFLITSIILNGLRDGSFRLGRFYLNRVRRLLPNAALAIVVTALIARRADLPSSAAQVARHGLWALFNLSNFFIRRHIGGYWGDAAAAAPLVHTWSLAVEEQFYLLFPALVLLLGKSRRFPAALGTAALASFALNLALAPTLRLVTFYLLPTRAWELLLGGLMATWRAPMGRGAERRTTRSVPALEIAGLIGLALILISCARISERFPYPGWAGLIPTLGTVGVLAAAMDGGSLVGRLLATPPLVALGRLSYSLYLWHWPLITLARNKALLVGGNETRASLLAAAASLGVATLVYLGVEQPLRRRGRGAGRRLAVIGALFAMAAATCGGLSRPTAAPIASAVFDPPSYHGFLYNLGASGFGGSVRAAKFRDVEIAEPADWRPQRWDSGGIVHRWGPTPPRVVVLGSSHALMYARAIDEACRSLGVSVAFLTSDGAAVFFDARPDESPLSPEQTRGFDRARRHWLEAWRPEAVVVADRWDAYEGVPGDLQRRARGLVRDLSPFTSRVILLTQPPVLRLGETVNLREYVDWRMHIAQPFAGIEPDGADPMRRAAADSLDALARQDPRVRVIRVDRQFYAPGGLVRVSSGRKFLYIDDDHLSDAGADLVRAPLEREIAAACRLPSPR